MSVDAQDQGQSALDVGQQQSVFREVNERIRDLAESFGLSDALEILCECGHSGCIDRISLSEAEYEELRLTPTHFAVISGHQIPGLERVVDENERFIVVEKYGESALAAIRLDPRARHA